MRPTLPEGVPLRHGRFRATVAPTVGGALAGLWFDDLPVLRCTPLAQLGSPRQGGSFALLPYSNRIGNGRLEWAGQTYFLEGPPGDAPHTIHGVGWRRPWQVQAVSAQAVTLTLEHAGDAAWPLAFAATQTLTLTETGLTLRLQAQNRHSAPVPMGLGWHPYFTKRAGAHLTFQTQRQWWMQPDRLPSHAVPHAGLSGPCADWQLDHCFDGWNGVAVLEDPQLRVTLQSDQDHLVVFTQPDLPFVAVEPVGHVNNALQLALAQQLPAPGMPTLAVGAACCTVAHIQVAPSLRG